MTKVLPKDTMVVLLTDLQLVSGAVNLAARDGKTVSTYSMAYTQQILEKHHIDTTIFRESLRYYSYHVEEMNKMYEQVIINLGKLESEVNKVP